MKHISPKKQSPRYSAETIPELHTEYSAETIPELPPNIYDEMPDLEPEYLEEENPNLVETEIEEDTQHINIEDIPLLLKELQNTSVEDIMDNNVRITELIQKCLLIGIA